MRSPGSATERGAVWGRRGVPVWVAPSAALSRVARECGAGMRRGVGTPRRSHAQARCAHARFGARSTWQRCVAASCGQAGHAEERWRIRWTTACVEKVTMTADCGLTPRTVALRAAALTPASTLRCRRELTLGWVEGQVPPRQTRIDY